MCVRVCTCAYEPTRRCWGGQKRAWDTLGGVTGCWELPCGCWGLHSGPLQGQQVLRTVKHPSILWSHPLYTAFYLCLLRSWQFCANHTMVYYWCSHTPVQMKSENLTSLHSCLSMNCLKHACTDNCNCRITVLVLPGRRLRKWTKVSFAYWMNTLLFVALLFLMIQESLTPSPFKIFTLLGCGGTHL